MNVWDAAMDLVWMILHGKGKGPGKVVPPDQTLGFGPVNTWHRVDHERLAGEVANNGLNCIQIEFLGFAEDKFYDNPEPLYGRMDSLMKWVSRNGLFVRCTIVNWNKGANGGSATLPSICNPKYDDAWYQGIVNRLKREYGNGLIDLLPASEWAGSRNKECTPKADRWCQWSAANWGGAISWNKASRPKSAPPGHRVEYHAGSTGDAGPRGGIVVSDHSVLIGQLKSKPALEAYVRKVRANGSGFCYYGYRDADIDVEAIKAIRRGAGR